MTTPFYDNYPNLSVNPAPASFPSVAEVADAPKTSAKSNLGASSPYLGASGVALFRLLSCPAFDGNVGNISFAFGLGSSLK